MNDNNHNYTQDAVQISDYGTEPFVDVAEKLRNTLSVQMKKGVLNVTPLQAPAFDTAVNASYAPYSAEADILLRLTKLEDENHILLEKINVQDVVIKAQTTHIGTLAHELRDLKTKLMLFEKLIKI